MKVFGIVLYLVALGMLLTGACGAEGKAYDPGNPESVKEEYRRINEEYKNDIPRLTEEINQLARKVAKAAGPNAEAELDRRERLWKKYGPAASVTEYLPTSKSAGKTIDHEAWRILVEKDRNTTVVSLFLDKPRYQGVSPTDLKFMLRRKGKYADQEKALNLGEDIVGAFCVPLAYEAGKGEVYTVRITIPPDEATRYVIEASAEIEPGWATRSTFELR